MTPINNNYSEDALVEQPAISLFGELGQQTENCYHEFDQDGKSFLGRDNKSDVVLLSRLKPVMQELNPNVSQEDIDEAIAELMRDRSMMSMIAANMEVYFLLKNGYSNFSLEAIDNENTGRVRFIN